MQYKKLSQQQRKIRQWRLKRNALVGKLLAKDSSLMSAEALKMANRMMRHR